MDPIRPISTPGFRGQGSLPVERLERLSRERDRPEQQPRRRRRERPSEQDSPERPPDDGRPHVDVRA